MLFHLRFHLPPIVSQRITLHKVMSQPVASETAAREGVEFGAFDYLVKPCELEDLIEKIKEAARKRKKDLWYGTAKNA